MADERVNVTVTAENRFGFLRVFYPTVRKLLVAKGWREHDSGEAPREGHMFAAMVALVHSEASEALEAYRDKVWSETCNATEPGIEHNLACSRKPHDHPKPVGVGPEMADTFIRVIDICDLWGIDLDYEVNRVLNYGWTRPYRHGGRQL